MAVDCCDGDAELFNIEFLRARGCNRRRALDLGVMRPLELLIRSVPEGCSDLSSSSQFLRPSAARQQGILKAGFNRNIAEMIVMDKSHRLRIRYFRCLVRQGLY